MRNRKYRIKKVIDGLGKSIYYPQYKGWFGWKYFKTYCMYKERKTVFSHLKDAQNYIDDLIKEVKSKEITSIKYIEYP